MISRIRIEAEGVSAAEVALELQVASDHLVYLGYLEGITPQSSRITDERIEKKKVREGQLPITVGRRIITFDVPEHAMFPAEPGYPQSEYSVVETMDYRPYGLHGHPDSETELVRRELGPTEVMVLRRVRPCREVSTDAQGSMWQYSFNVPGGSGSIGSSGNASSGTSKDTGSGPESV